MVADHVLRDEAGRVPGVLIRERLRLMDGVGQGQKRVEYRQVRVGRSVGARGLGLEGLEARRITSSPRARGRPCTTPLGVGLVGVKRRARVRARPRVREG